MGFLSVRQKGGVGLALAIDGVQHTQSSIDLEAERSQYVTFPNPPEVNAWGY